MRRAHSGQFRTDGETPYHTHPEAVMLLLEHYGFKDEEMLCAALLHDVLEDTSRTYKDVEEHFGRSVAKLVLELTNPRRSTSMNDSQWRMLKDQNWRMMSERATIIKMADRLHNLKSMDHTWDASKRRWYGRTTIRMLNIFSIVPVRAAQLYEDLLAEAKLHIDARDD